MGKNRAVGEKKLEFFPYESKLLLWLHRGAEKGLWKSRIEVA